MRREYALSLVAMAAIEHRALNLHAFNKGRVVVKACSGYGALHSFEVTPALTGRFTHGYVALGDSGSLSANCRAIVTDIGSMRLKDIF